MYRPRRNAADLPTQGIKESQRHLLPQHRNQGQNPPKALVCSHQNRAAIPNHQARTPDPAKHNLQPAHVSQATCLCPGQSATRTALGAAAQEGPSQAAKNRIQRRAEPHRIPPNRARATRSESADLSPETFCNRQVVKSAENQMIQTHERTPN